MAVGSARLLDCPITGKRGSSERDSIRPRSEEWLAIPKPSRLEEYATGYFGVVISLTEVAQLTKGSRGPPEMYSVAMKMFSPSAAAPE